MSERRVVEAAEDFATSSLYPGYYYGSIVGTDPYAIYLKGYKPGKGELMVVEPDDKLTVEVRHRDRLFKIVEEDDE